MKKFNEVYDCDSITINVTNNCNLHCIYCFEHEKNKNFMSPKTAIDIIDKSYNNIDKRKGEFTINIFGGEPLLNWETIKELIDHCNEKKYNVKYGITTNLTLLTDEMIQYIDDNEIMMLVSIDGIKEVHDKNRCNSYDIAVENLKDLINHKLGIFVEARMTILPEDAKYAMDGVKDLINLGVNNICPMPVTDVDWNKEQLADLKQYYNSLMKYYISILNDDLSTRNISIKNTDEILTNVLEPEVTDPIMCPIYSNKWCAFDTNGDVYACHQGPTSEEPFKSNMRLGNIYTGIDETKLRKSYSYATYPKDECKSCVARPVCKCGCPSENMRMNNSEYIPTDGYCKTQRILVESVKLYQNQIINASNIRNRSINLLKENIKIKLYLDKLLATTDFNDRLQSITRLMHLQEMINNLGEKNIYPTFKSYLAIKENIILASLLTITNQTLANAMDKTKEANDGK